jgi:hypothetical protein
MEEYKMKQLLITIALLLITSTAFALTTSSSIDGSGNEVITITLTPNEQAFLKDRLSADTTIEAWIKGALTGKLSKAKGLMKNKWNEVLTNDTEVTSIPTDETEWLTLVTTRPDYDKGTVTLTLDQQKKVKVKTFRKNIKEFTNTLPDGDPRYDADLKLGLMNAIMAYTIAGQPVPEGLANAKTWLMTVQGLFVSKKAAIKAVETQEALDAIIITIADLESKYGREGTVLADPGISTADLM